MEKLVPKVSVIVPVYNVEKYLDRCIVSIVGQTLSDIEIILVDDGSPDNCPAMCDDWSKRDKRIKVIHKKNGGLGFARNSGMNIATGEYIIFCDSDDKVAPEMYETLYNATEGGKYDVVYSGFNVEQKIGRWSKENDYNEVRTFDSTNSEKIALSFIVDTDITEGHRYVMSCNVALYKRSLLESNHICQMSEREVGSEDMIFQLQVALQAKNVKFIPQCFYYYYMNEGSLTHTFKQSKFRAAFRIREKMRKIMPLKPINEAGIDAEFYGRIRSLVTQLVCDSGKTFKSKYRMLRKLCQSFTTTSLNLTIIKENPWKYWYALKLIKANKPFALICFTYFDRYINKKNLLFWKKY